MFMLAASATYSWIMTLPCWNNSISGSMNFVVSMSLLCCMIYLPDILASVYKIICVSTVIGMIALLLHCDVPIPGHWLALSGGLIGMFVPQSAYASKYSLTIRQAIHYLRCTSSEDEARFAEFVASSREPKE